MFYFALARQHDVLLCTGKTTRCPTLHQRQHDVLLCIKDNTMSYFASKTTQCPTLHQRQHGVLFSTDRTTQYLALAGQNGKCLTLHSLESASYFAVVEQSVLCWFQHVLSSAGYNNVSHLALSRTTCLILHWFERRVSSCTG